MRLIVQKKIQRVMEFPFACSLTGAQKQKKNLNVRLWECVNAEFV